MNKLRPLPLFCLLPACEKAVYDTAPVEDSAVYESSTWYPDDDGDGYGDDEAPAESPNQPTGYVAQGGDCDDADATVHPGAQELCDERDND